MQIYLFFCFLNKFFEKILENEFDCMSEEESFNKSK